MNKIHYNNCPVCDSSDISAVMVVKDHSVSGEEFPIWQCNSCTLRFTQDVPDEHSIAPYYASPDYISHTNTNEGLINRMYQRVRRFTLDQKAKLIAKNTSARGFVLDVGAGIGAFLDNMSKKGWQVMGVEPDRGARNIALKQFNLRLGGLDALQLFDDKHFEAITMWHVLEHVHQLHPTIEEVKRLLSKNGRLFIAVPNYTAGDATSYQSYWAAYDVPRHLYHFTPKSISVLMEKHGLKVIAKKPMWFDSFYISLLSSRYRNKKTNWVGAGTTALFSNLKALGNRDRCSSITYIITRSDAK